MEIDYFGKAMSLASKDDCKILLNLLKDPEAQHVRDSVQDNPLIIEGENWKIAFYSQLDIKDAIQFLEDKIQGLVPA